MLKNLYIYRLLMFKDYIDYWYKMIWNMVIIIVLLFWEVEDGFFRDCLVLGG